jgi:hypothetical protein
VEKQAVAKTEPKIVPVVSQAEIDTALQFSPEIVYLKRDGKPTPFKTRETIKSFQVVGINWLRNRTRALLCDDMGCLSGETLISINRSKNGFKITLAELYRKFNGLEGSWDLKIPTMVRSLNENDEIRLNRAMAVLSKGKKEVAKLILASGKEVRATLDHEIATPTGYTALASLLPGDTVLTNGQQVCLRCGSDQNLIQKPESKFFGYCKRCMYRHGRKTFAKSGTGFILTKDGYRSIVSGMRYHPNYTTSGILEHRLVAEAAVNGLNLDEWLLIIRENRFTSDSVFLSKDTVVHHKNENKLDNQLENLEMLSSNEHQALHGIAGGYLHLDGGVGRFIPIVDTVVSVSPDGCDEVYDIACDDPNRNFVAGGIIVHNCGKTCQSITSIDPYSPVVIITTASTQQNWAEEIGIWRPDIKPFCAKTTNFRWPAIHEAVITCWSSLPRIEAPKTGGVDPVDYTVKALEEMYGTIPYNVTVIYDECHYGKTKKAYRTRTAAALGRLALQNGGKVWGLTGTPLPNKPPDLFGVLSLVDLADEIWPDWRSFVKSFGGKKKKDGKFGYDWGKPSLEVREYLQKIMLRRLAQNYLGLPPISFHEIMIPRDRLSGTILADCDSLIQWAGGPEKLEIRMDSIGNEDMKFISSTREAISAALVPTVQIIANEFVRRDIPVAVFSAHRAIVDVLAQDPNWVTVRGGDTKSQRYEAVQSFQSGFIKKKGVSKLVPIKGIAFTTAGCEGITLTRAKVLIRASLDWTPGRNEQAVRRLSRIGQESPVEVIDILADHPLEKILYAALKKKELTLREAGLELRTEETEADRIAVPGELENIGDLAEDIVDEIQG